MKIDYDHSLASHSLPGPTAALQVIFGSVVPESLLDVGCGTGTWLRAASDLGIADVAGVDGIVPKTCLQISKDVIKQHDLSKPFHLGRRFEAALCLEVAEHLPDATASVLVSSIVAHTDAVLFSAACPGQAGQHHVNCRWPSYWQEHFNHHGFRCDDSIRWQIWDDARIEPWYRQNMFWARRDPANAGQEPRLKAVLHPDMLPSITGVPTMELVEAGSYPFKWYVTGLTRGFLRKAASRTQTYWRARTNFG